MYRRLLPERLLVKIFKKLDFSKLDFFFNLFLITTRAFYILLSVITRAFAIFLFWMYCEVMFFIYFSLYVEFG